MKENDHHELKTAVGQRARKAALVQLQSGCLTFGVAMIAIIIGLWVDLRLETTPRWTLTLLIGSAPFVLVGVYLLARRSLRQIQSPPEPPDADEMDA